MGKCLSLGCSIPPKMLFPYFGHKLKQLAKIEKTSAK